MRRQPWLRTIEQPPWWWRRICRHALFRIDTARREVFLTFDDGPVPEVTPWVLDQLDRYGALATFFMVGDNVRRYPALARRVADAGHTVGNHTMHHLQGLHTPTALYMADTAHCNDLTGSKLFRPPHGLLRPRQAKKLAERYTIVMHDVLTRDYSRRMDAEAVAANVRRYTRPGAVIVFHDSLKAWPRLQQALPQSLEWLRQQGYAFAPLPQQ